MSKTEFNLFNQLKLTKKQWKIKAIVSRMWIGYNFKANDLVNFNVLLMDENEDQIHAMITDKDLIDKFSSNLIEGTTYIFENMNVAMASGTHRPLLNKYVMFFNNGTTITAVDEDWPLTRRDKFNFIEFEDLKARFHDKTKSAYLTDVIGNLTSVQPVRSTIANGKKTQLRDIILENNSGTKVKITLWDEKAKIIDEKVIKNHTGKIVVIAASTKISLFRGDYNLASVSATKLYINADFPEVKAYKEGSKECEGVQIVEIQDDIKTQDEEQLSNNMKTISELVETAKGCSDLGRKYACEATILKIYIEDGGWYYMSCSYCWKKIFEDNNAYYCISCGKDNENPIPRYKLKMTAGDGSGEATFVAFDKDVESLLKQPAVELCEMLKKENGVEKVKILFEQKFLCSKYVFQLKVNDFMRQKGQTSFTVNKMHPTGKERKRISEEKNDEDEINVTSNGFDTPKRTQKRIKLEEEEDDDTISGKEAECMSSKL